MACHHTALAGLEQNSAKHAGVELVLILISASQMLDYWYATPCHWHVCFLLPPPFYLMWYVQLWALPEARGQSQSYPHWFSLLCLETLSLTGT